MFSYVKGWPKSFKLSLKKEPPILKWSSYLKYPLKNLRSGSVNWIDENSWKVCSWHLEILCEDVVLDYTFSGFLALRGTDPDFYTLRVINQFLMSLALEIMLFFRSAVGYNLWTLTRDKKTFERIPEKVNTPKRIRSYLGSQFTGCLIIVPISDILLVSLHFYLTST